MSTDTARYDEWVERARGGDELAFERLLIAHRAELRSVVRRMIGHPEDTDDVVQEATFRAWQGLASFEGESKFSTWLCAIGVRQSIDHLRSRKRWRARAQVVYQQACAEDADLAGEVVATLADPEFRFSVAEHIAYCFSCVGRSLPPEDQAALLLREVMGLGNREAAKLLDLGEPAFQHSLESARRAMQQEFEGLCALVSPQGTCYQCKGLRNGTPEERQGDELPTLASFDERLAFVRSANLDTGASQLLHDLFWRRTSQLEEAGIGSDDLNGADPAEDSDPTGPAGPSD